ncbi:MAG: HD domain-containing phosphohydrolase [Candidatus Aminicenantaceae bacterium]
MKDRIKETISVFFSAVQTGKIYAENHPESLEVTENAFLSLGEIFQNTIELVIGIVGDELAWEDEVFFDLSKKLRSVIYYLKDRNIERIYIHQALTLEELRRFIALLSSAKGEFQRDSERLLIQNGIKNIRTSKIKDIDLDQLRSRDDWNKMQELYDNALDTIGTTVENIVEGKAVENLDIRFDMLNMLDFFMGRHQELITLISVKKKDMITFAHLCNVAILSMHLGSRLGFNKDDVMELGVASLFHDIGKIAISSRILKKKARLDDEEFRKMREHPLFGSRILSGYIDTLGIIPVVVAYEHHRRYDLQGYPQVDYPKRPHVASLIVSLCDVYDALAQRRTYKKDYPPNKIYEIMSEEKGKLFDPELFDKFYASLGVWPVGTIVQLSDSRIAVVREINEEDIFGPRVEIVSSVGRGEFLDMSDKKQKVKIDKALNPFGKGKEFMPCI